jgi:hypothetical protein
MIVVGANPHTRLCPWFSVRCASDETRIKKPLTANGFRKMDAGGFTFQKSVVIHRGQNGALPLN